MNIQKIILPFIVAFFASCTLQQVDVEQELIRNYMPGSTETCVGHGRYGEYSYNMYKHGLEILALSPDIQITYAEVWDVNHDGAYDSVWILDQDTWRFWSNIKHPILTNDPNPNVLRNFIGLSNLMRAREENKPSLASREWSF